MDFDLAIIKTSYYLAVVLSVDLGCAFQWGSALSFNCASEHYAEIITIFTYLVIYILGLYLRLTDLCESCSNFR